MSTPRRVLLVQLPIPPVGPEPIRGNVPLAAGYLKMFAERHGLAGDYQSTFCRRRRRTRSAIGLVEAILAGEPWMVGFTCYLWNIERTLWIAERLKDGAAGTADLARRAGDHGRQRLGAAARGDRFRGHRRRGTDVSRAAARRCDRTIGRPSRLFPALYVRRPGAAVNWPLPLPPPRRPLPNLDRDLVAVSGRHSRRGRRADAAAWKRSAAASSNASSATTRKATTICISCRKKRSSPIWSMPGGAGPAKSCCWTRRSISAATFRRSCGCWLGENPERQFTYFGELRAEGITAEVARLLQRGEFHRSRNRPAIDRSAGDGTDGPQEQSAGLRARRRAMLDLGIKVKVDLIIGLPGDTVDSVRRGLDYVHCERPVFRSASVQPGDAARHGVPAGGGIAWAWNIKTGRRITCSNTPTLAL